MRRLSTSGITPFMPTVPACAAFWIGDSGGTYQTIGRVRYSGCSGSASFQSMASLYTGDCLAASSQLSGMPSARAAAITAGSSGSRKISRCAWYRSFSAATDAASAMRSASYNITPR
ncbi:hypothetical protein D3C71_1513580 [compost metagenome]